MQYLHYLPGMALHQSDFMDTSGLPASRLRCMRVTLFGLTHLEASHMRRRSNTTMIDDDRITAVAELL
jgi:hypothetical protein